MRLLDADIQVTAFTRHCGINQGCNQVLENLAHREELLRLKTQARAPKGRDRLQQAVPVIVALFVQWLLADRNVGWLTLRTLKLLDLYDGTILWAAVAQALAHDICDLGSLSLVCESQRRTRSRPVLVDLPLGAHVPRA